jgi:hypothetical protein
VGFGAGYSFHRRIPRPRRQKRCGSPPLPAPLRPATPLPYIARPTPSAIHKRVIHRSTGTTVAIAIAIAIDAAQPPSRIALLLYMVLDVRTISAFESSMRKRDDGLWIAARSWHVPFQRLSCKMVASFKRRTLVCHVMSTRRSICFYSLTNRVWYLSSSILPTSPSPTPSSQLSALSSQLSALSSQLRFWQAIRISHLISSHLISYPLSSQWSILSPNKPSCKGQYSGLDVRICTTFFLLISFKYSVSHFSLRSRYSKQARPQKSRAKPICTISKILTIPTPPLFCSFPSFAFLLLLVHTHHIPPLRLASPRLTLPHLTSPCLTPQSPPPTLQPTNTSS